VRKSLYIGEKSVKRGHSILDDDYIHPHEWGFAAKCFWYDFDMEDDTDDPWEMEYRYGYARQYEGEMKKLLGDLW